MSKYKNVFGRLEYSIEKDGNVFSVTHKRDCDRPYTIQVTRCLSGGGCVCSDAIMLPFWDAPCFSSFVHAVAFLKKNISELY